MQVIISYLQSMGEAFLAGFQYLIWMFTGMGNLATMMGESIVIMEDVLQFFPRAVSSTLISMLGGLIVLRIFGRS